jgi:predicted signal transduction protein with EAL and GGDEF domain
MVSGAHEDKPCADTAILVRRDGVELNVKNCSGYIRDRDGNVTGTVAVLHDLGAVRAQILEISQAAQHDFLTGLPNRSLVNDRITQAISFSARYSKQLAVMFVDFDLFKLRVVAEGVETEEQLHFLQQKGCSEGQGYFFCRPVIAEKFAQFLQRGVTESMVH